MANIQKVRLIQELSSAVNFLTSTALGPGTDSFTAHCRCCTDDCVPTSKVCPSPNYTSKNYREMGERKLAYVISGFVYCLTLEDGSVRLS
jgi:hypothetical protein